MAAAQTGLVRSIGTIEQYIGASSDDKPLTRSNSQVTSAGSTFYEKDTGLTFVFDGFDWVQQLDPVMTALLEEVQGVRSEMRRSNDLLEQIAESLKHNE